MRTALDRGWAEAVCSVCDPVFESADVGFVRQLHSEPVSGGITSLLWEADPRRFAERYPNSKIVDSYGQDQWPPPCIDYWVYVDEETQQARISVEGWNVGDQVVDLSGDGVRDGLIIADFVAGILRVTSPLTGETS